MNDPQGKHADSSPGDSSTTESSDLAPTHESGAKESASTSEMISTTEIIPSPFSRGSAVSETSVTADEAAPANDVADDTMAAPSGDETLDESSWENGPVNVMFEPIPSSSTPDPLTDPTLATAEPENPTPSAEPLAVATLATESPINSATASLTPAIATPSGGASLGTVILFTWASLATILAAWLWWHWPPPTGSLENLPDDGELGRRIISPLEPLASNQVASLGQTLRVGDLEVTPVQVVERRLTLLPDKIVTEPVLALELKVKNVSSDRAFHPTEPAFVYPSPKKRIAGIPAFSRSGYSYTFLHPVDNLTAIILPYELPMEIGMTVDGQTFPKLDAGATGTVWLFSEERTARDLTAPMIWRVKLRRQAASDENKGLATVIGVSFAPKDVKGLKADATHKGTSGIPSRLRVALARTSLAAATKT